MQSQQFERVIVLSGSRLLKPSTGVRQGEREGERERARRETRRDIETFLCK